MTAQVGLMLREWRGRRRLSQLDLARLTDTPPAALGAVEACRAKPTRAQLLRLADALSMPAAAQNALLVAAGLEPAYPDRPLDAPELGPVQDAIRWTLRRHAPYPAFALDRRWRVVELNQPAELLFAPFGLGPGESLLRALADLSALRDAVVNWSETARRLLNRLCAESAALGGDAELDAAAEALRRGLEAESWDVEAPPPVAPTVFRFGAQELAFLGLVARFDAAADILASELKIDLLFPADDATRRFLEALPD